MNVTRFAPRRLAVAVAAVVAVAVTPAALSQGVLEEVIVTAQKRAQSLQDVPIAVSAFSAEMIEKTGDVIQKWWSKTIAFFE